LTQDVYGDVGGVRIRLHDAGAGRVQSPNPERRAPAVPTIAFVARRLASDDSFGDVGLAPSGSSSRRDGSRRWLACSAERLGGESPLPHMPLADQMIFSTVSRTVTLAGQRSLMRASYPKMG
jgi:hypothetical protein